MIVIAELPITLQGIATAVPEHKLPQNLVLENARRILGARYSQFERMAKTFTTSGVESRYSFAPFEWFETEKNWPERNALYVEGGQSLFIEVTQKALVDAGLQAKDIDTVVTVSSTGIATPTLEARALKELGFKGDIVRVPVFGLGCAGGVSGIAIARSLACAKPNSHVLIVALEACTLSFRADRLTKADIIATVLFGDGAAAAILSDAENSTGVTFGEGHQETWIDTLDIMGWDVDELGLGVVFDRSIPAFAQENLREAAEKALTASGSSIEDVDRFICHPGGAKVVEAIEESLGLSSGSLVEERETLRDFGNMSAPTALFVLERVLRGNKTQGQCVMSALGPGFTASFVPVDIANSTKWG